MIYWYLWWSSHIYIHIHIVHIHTHIHTYKHIHIHTFRHSLHWKLPCCQCWLFKPWNCCHSEVVVGHSEPWSRCRLFRALKLMCCLSSSMTILTCNVYIYTCVYIYTHIYIHTYIYIYIYIYMLHSTKIISLSYAQYCKEHCLSTKCSR